MTNNPLPVTPADIDAAAKVIAPFAVRTPLLSSPALNARVGANVFLKPELLQRTGSFKFRGAFNKLSSIPQAKRSGGVVAFSSGNHAQGVAAAAQILNMRAVIVMPADAPASKRERSRAINEAVREVAAHLGNTLTVCKRSYVHPVIYDAFDDGSLAKRWDGAAPPKPAGLTSDERRLWHLLGRA